MLPFTALPRPVGGVGGEPLRLQVEAGFGAVDHSLGRRNLIVGPRRRRLDIDDHRVLDVGCGGDADDVAVPLIGGRLLGGLAAIDHGAVLLRNLGSRAAFFSWRCKRPGTNCTPGDLVDENT